MNRDSAQHKRNQEFYHLLQTGTDALPLIQATLYHLNDVGIEYQAWACATTAPYPPTLSHVEAFQRPLSIQHDLPPYRVACVLCLEDGDASWVLVCFHEDSAVYDHTTDAVLQRLRLPLLDLVERHLEMEWMQRALHTTRSLLMAKSSHELLDGLYRYFLVKEQHSVILLTRWDALKESDSDGYTLGVGVVALADESRPLKNTTVQMMPPDGTSHDGIHLVAQLFDDPSPHIHWQSIPYFSHGRGVMVVLVGWHQNRLQDRIAQTIFLEELQPSFEVWCHQFYQQIISDWVNTQDVVDGVQEGLLLVRVQGGNAKVVLENMAFKQLFNLDERQTVVGLWLYELLIRIPLELDMRKALRKVWDDILVEPCHPYSLHIHLTDLHGMERIIDWFCVPIPSSSGLSHTLFVFSFRDVTKEHATREARLNFFSRISHELRTPLTSIRGFTEMLLQHTDETFSQETQEYLQIIAQSSHHLETVLRDILEIIRLDAGDTKFKLQPVAFSNVLKEAIQQSRELYNQGERHIVLKDQTRSAYVMADRNRLVRVLTNLIGNAMIYSPSKSPIHLSIQRCDAIVDLPKHAPQDMAMPCLLLEIRDNGNGLSVQDVERVFEPFYRSKQVIKERIPGVGLGLTVVRSFVEKQQGKSWATVNEPNSPGGRFYLALPLTEKPKKKP